MANIQITIDASDVQKKLALFKKQIPFATALAMTATAKGAVADLQSEMKKVFDRPTSWTMRAWYAKPARKNDLTAWVASRESAPGGRPASKYLSPEILGGVRNLKGFERALFAISGGQYAMPGKDAKIDAFGNMSRGQIVMILSRLSILRDPLQNITDRTRARLARKGLVTRGAGLRSDIFVARERGSGRPVGIYQLIGPGRVAQLLIFTSRRPTYKPILNFDKIVMTSIEQNWERHVAASIETALRTANAE